MSDDGPFIDLADCVRSARWAADEALKRAMENPDDAQRHMERRIWLIARAEEWESEMRRVAHIELEQQLRGSLELTK